MNSSIQQTILDTARELLQIRGWHGFSYRDIATSVGIRAASIHYYFPAKDDLAVAVATEILHDFLRATERIEAEVRDVPEQLHAFAALFSNTFAAGDRLCPICMLAVCQDTVSVKVRNAVAEFWRECEAWLEKVLERGAKDGALLLNLDAGQAARTWVAALEGSMVTGRVFNDAERVMATFAFLLAQVRSPLSESTSGTRDR